MTMLKALCYAYKYMILKKLIFILISAFAHLSILLYQKEVNNTNVQPRKIDRPNNQIKLTIINSPTNKNKNLNKNQSTFDNFDPVDFNQGHTFIDRLESTQLLIKDSKNKTIDNDIYFSFYQRVALDYINKLKQELYKSSPLLDKNLPINDLLIGKITFGPKGNAQTLKIIQWSPNDKVQLVFTKALESIRKIPNPPKKLISKNGEFSVFYGFRVRI